MACCGQMTRPKEKVDTQTWSKTFPSEMKTHEDSFMMMKKLMAVAISEILYLRAIFPEKAFGNRNIEDLNIMILSDSSKIPGACDVIRWMRGCFHALEKKYLRQIMLVFYLDEDKPDEVIESYTFRFAYHDDTTSITCNDEEVMSTTSAPKTMQEIRKATLSLLRTTILLTQHLEPLPESAYLGMKLLYYDEVTPDNYQPEGFMNCVNPNYSFLDEPMNVKVGEVNTQFHTMKLRVKTNKNQFDYDDAPKISTESANTTTTNSVTEVVPNNNANRSEEIQMNNDIKVQNKENIENENSNKEGLNIPMDSPSAKSTNSEMSVKSLGGLVQCPCGDNENDGLMVQCVGCKCWQHGVCFSILNNESAPDKHYCHACGDVQDPKKAPTDFYLNSLDCNNRKVLCMWRRTLSFCSEQKSVEKKQLCDKLNTSGILAKTLIDRLLKENFITTGKGRYKNMYLVKEDVLLSQGFPLYMKRQATSVDNSDTHANKESLTTVPFKERDNYITSTVKTTNNKRVDTPKLQEKITELADETKLLSVSQKPVRSKKVVAPKRKQLLDMDFSESQDLSFSKNRACKRRKSSVTRKGLAV